METPLFASTIVAYFTVAFVWPIWCSWKRHGVWPVVFHREAAPAQRLLGLLLGILLVALVVAAVLFPVYGAKALGVWRAPLLARVGGWLLMAVGTVVTVVAQKNRGVAWRVGIDDRPTTLVTNGLFRFCRNPIFSGLLAFLTGIALVCPAWWSIGGVLVTGLAIRLQVVFEEQHLAAMHGAAYVAYAARTGRFVPLIGRLRERSGVRQPAGYRRAEASASEVVVKS
jgi:protein-S-isoprenylcysteine O-methyltransferase Ste14